MLLMQYNDGQDLLPVEGSGPNPQRFCMSTLALELSRKYLLVIHALFLPNFVLIERHPRQFTAAPTY
jgi:hypothetical protein